MIKQSNFRLLAAVFLLLAFSQQLLSAKVTLQVNLGGELAVADGTVGVLVVDRSGDGFLSPDHSSVVGTKLEAGQQIGLSDDIIIGVLQSSTSDFSGGSGFVGLIRRIDYDALQLQPGMTMTFYWFPGVTTPGATLGNANNYETFRTNNASNVPNTVTFQLPARRGLFNLAYLDAGNGGTFDISNPGANGDHSNGTTGTDDSVLPGGGGSDVDQNTDTGGNPTLVDVDWNELAKGRYEGLITGGGLRVDGEISVNLTNTGRASIRMNLGGVTALYSGTLNLPAADLINIAVPRRNATDLILNLALRQDSNTGSYFLVGTVEADGVVSNIEVTQNAYQRDRTAVAQEGTYTFALPAPGGANQTAIPSGDGIGTVRISRTGRVSALMVLGDGTVTSDSTTLSDDGIWQLYRAIYANKGFIAGRVSFRDVANITDFDGPLHWSKPAETRPTTRSYYPLGFDTTVNLVGSVYVRPRRGAPMVAQFADTPNNVEISVDGGMLDPAFAQKTLTWDYNNRVSFPGAAAGERLSISPISTTGAVNGSYRRTYVDGNGRNAVQTVQFKAVALQKQGIVTGNFKGQNQTTGVMTIDSTGEPMIVVQDAGAAGIANGGTLDFGNIGVDGGIGERIVEIQNTGQGVLYLDEMPTLSDPRFGLVSGRMGYIQPGESSRLRVRFDPDAEAAFASTLTIMSNDRTNNPFVVNLIGTGVAGSSSTIDAGTNRNHAAAPPSPAAATAFSNVNYDEANSNGTFGGVLIRTDVIGAVGGTASLRVTAIRNTGTGRFSGTVILGSTRGSVTGTINADGSATITRFSGILARDWTLGNIQLQQSPGGKWAVAGTLTNNTTAEVINLQLGHQNFSSKNKATQEGSYTLVIPANENLGAGYPSGDSVAIVRVTSTGNISAVGSMADGESVNLSGKLNSDGTWDIFRKWIRGEVGGRVTFRDVPNVSDFDGTVRWTRPSHTSAQRFHEGFAIQADVLGSLFQRPRRGARIINELPDGVDNAVVTINDLDPAVGNRNATWNESNRISVTGADAFERVTISASSTTGAIVASYSGRYDDNGTQRTRRVAMKGVAFQKQGLATGYWIGGVEAGFFGIQSAGVAVIGVADASGTPVGNGGNFDLGNVGVDGGIGERILEISNTGQGALFIPDAPELASTANWGVVASRTGFIQPGESARLRVRFDPDGEAAFATTLTILSNDRTNNPYVINIMGAGVAGSASNVDAGVSRNHADIPGSPAAAAAFTDANYDEANSNGNFGGALTRTDVVGGVGGSGSLRVTAIRGTGTGRFSGTLIIGTKRGSVTGTVNADGTTTITRFSGILANDWTLNSLRLRQNPSGDQAFVGTLTHNTTGEVVNILLIQQSFSSRNKTPLEGIYTMVIPANENLGAGYPSGDSIATIRLSATGTIFGAFAMADGQIFGISGKLNNDGSWDIYRSWREGELGGRVVFRDVPNVSDFDGLVRWVRPVVATAQRFHEGFSMDLQALGSLYVRPRSKARMISQLPDGANNAQVNIADLDPAVGLRAATWSELNRVTVAAADAFERTTVSPLATTGAVNGNYRGRYDDNGVTRTRTIPFKAVAFQKQGLVTGNWVKGTEAGFVGITSVGTPTLGVVDSGGGAIANGGTVDFGNIGVDGGTGERVVVVQNTGTGNLFIPESPFISGANADQFYVSKQRAGFVGPGESITLRIGFNPSAIAAAAATLEIPNNDRSNASFTLALIGAGVAGSASNVEGELGTAAVTTPGSPAADPATADVNFDGANHAGTFNGLVRESVGGNFAEGSASLRITARPDGTGSISGSIKIGSDNVRLIGTVNVDGTITPTSVTAGFAVNNLRIVETAGGTPSLDGQVNDLDSGDIFDLDLGQAGYSTANPAPAEGKYTVVIPSNESLGNGAPDGDSVGTATVNSRGAVSIRMAMADGDLITILANLDGEDRFSFFRKGRYGTLGGTVTVRDVANVSDFDGGIFWDRAPRSLGPTFHEGFNLEGQILGSRFNFVSGQALFTGLTHDGSANINATFRSEYDPLTGVPATVLGPFTFVWETTNRVTQTAVADEQVRLSPSTSTGAVNGAYRNTTTRENFTVKGVVFQKQNIGPGNFQSTAGKNGKVTITPAP